MTTDTRLTTTYSMWSKFRNCRRACYWRYVKQIVPIQTKEASLWFGSLIHECLEIWHDTRKLDSVLEHIDRTCLTRDSDPDVKRDWNVARAMMMAYAEQYPAEGFTVVELEKEFTGEIINPATGAKSKSFVLSGKVDGIVQKTDGTYWLASEGFDRRLDAVHRDGSPSLAIQPPAHRINAWRAFALGDEIGVRCKDETIEKESRDLFWRLDLNDFVRDMISQLLVKGDAVGYVVPSNGKDDLDGVICVNPVSVKFTYENETLIEAVQHPVNADGVMGEPIPLSLDQLLHLKWNCPEFETHGNSMVLPAFEAIELLRDYRRAERAIARRWATPMRFIQVGGAYGSRIITPDQKMIEKVRDEVDRMDLKSGLVVPFYVKAETYGAEGISLNTEEKVRETKEDIMTALGLGRGIISGDGPNFATASVSMQKMIVQLKEIKEAARRILDWVFEEWLTLKGYEDAELHYQFSDLDLNAEVDQKKLLIDLYDRNLISKNTLQQKMGLSPDIEEQGRKDEEIVVDRNWSVQEISQLVALEVLTVEEARERLGLKKPVEKAKEEAARADVERIYAKQG